MDYLSTDDETVTDDIIPSEKVNEDESIGESQCIGSEEMIPVHIDTGEASVINVCADSEEMIPVHSNTEESSVISVEVLSDDALQKLLSDLQSNSTKEVDELSALLKSWNQEELIQHFKGL